METCHPNCEKHGKSPCEGVDCSGRDADDRAALLSNTETIRVTVAVDTDELRRWADHHADRGHHGVAHVLYKAASDGESLSEQHDRELAERTAKLTRRALLDPGSFVPRGAGDGHPHGERLDHWQARATEAAIAEAVAAR